MHRLSAQYCETDWDASNSEEANFKAFSSAITNIYYFEIKKIFWLTGVKGTSECVIPFEFSDWCCSVTLGVSDRRLSAMTASFNRSSKFV